MIVIVFHQVDKVLLKYATGPVVMLYRMILNLLVYINKWFGILITKVVYFERAKYSAKKTKYNNYIAKK